MPLKFYTTVSTIVLFPSFILFTPILLP